MPIISKTTFVVGVLMCAFVLYGLVFYQDKQIKRLKATNADLQAQNSLLSTQYEITQEAYVALSQAEADLNKKYQPAIKRTLSAPPTDDAPIAPVLQRALEAL